MIRKKRDHFFPLIDRVRFDLQARQNSGAPPPPLQEAGENSALSAPLTRVEDVAIGNEAPTKPLLAVVSDEVPEDPAVKHARSPSKIASALALAQGDGDGDLASLLQNSFVLVKPATFLMGSPECEAGHGSDEDPHEVTITKPFHIQNGPVTQKVWEAVMGNNPASFRDGGDDLPVETVSWNDCQEFLKRLNAMQGTRYRLPSETEWEYACRAGSFTAFATGDISELYCGCDPILWGIGWYCANSRRKTRPVAGKTPNGWGLFDMHGNISEWCMDWYGAYPAKACKDPRGPKSGPGKVVRGGSWFSSAKNCRSAARYWWPPALKSDFIGFRLVKEA